jgi:hypothetical protein
VKETIMGQQKNDAAKDGINREGARRYDEGVRNNARSGASERQAREAERAIDGPEGAKLREAEQQGKDAARHERR